MRTDGFISTLADIDRKGRVLINRRTGQPVAIGIEAALTRGARRRGLLGRDALEPSAALVLAPCFAIHTAFMRFKIDVVFVDYGGRVVRIVQALPPWRVAVSPRAHAVVELAAGSLGSGDLVVGDYIRCEASQPSPRGGC